MNLAASIKNIVLPDYPAFKCDRIILMESRLNPEGAKYTKLKEFFL
jgi:2'-5' RNA ligase